MRLVMRLSLELIYVRDVSLPHTAINYQKCSSEPPIYFVTIALFSLWSLLRFLDTWLGLRFF